MDGPADDGIISYLIWMVVGLCSLVFTLVQKHFGTRVKQVEDDVEKMEDHHDACQMNLAKDRREWDRKFEARRLENKEDFRLLHKKVEDGHRQILTELRKNNGRA